MMKALIVMDRLRKFSSWRRMGYGGALRDELQLFVELSVVRVFHCSGFTSKNLSRRVLYIGIAAIAIINFDRINESGIIIASSVGNTQVISQIRFTCL